MTMKKFVLLAGLIFAAACTTPNKPYHLDPLSGTVPDYENSIPLEGGNKLWFIESDDMGFLFNDSQFTKTLAAIRTANMNKDGALVVTYVHGWNHNAAPNNKNFTNFTRILNEIIRQEAMDTQCGTPRPVVGIYVGWRGKLFRSSARGLFIPTYFNRSNAASRVAMPTQGEVLAAITRTTRLTNKNHASRSVVIGHSMGGLITETALIPVMQDVLELNAVADKKEMSRYTLPADLVILVNPASRAMMAAQFRTMLSRWRVAVTGTAPSPYDYSSSKEKEAKRPWRPLLVSVTSEKDWATGWTFTAGNTIPALPKRFLWDQRKSKGMKLPFGEQWDLFRRTAGHWPDLHTHSLALEKAIGNDEPGDLVRPCNKQGRMDANVGCIEVGPDRFKFFEQTETSIPYWIMSVDPKIIGGHDFFEKPDDPDLPSSDGEVDFNPRFYRLLKGLLALGGGFQRPQTCPSSIWGPPVPPENIVSHVPQACEQPPELVVEATCAGTGPCSPTDPWQFTLHYSEEDGRRGQPYEPQPCDTISWSFKGDATQYVTTDAGWSHVPAQAMSFSTKDGVIGEATITNHRGIRTVLVKTDRRGIVPVSIGWTGQECTMKDGKCKAGEQIRFEPTLPEKLMQGKTFWMAAGEKVRETPDVRRLSVRQSRSLQSRRTGRSGRVDRRRRNVDRDRAALRAAGRGAGDSGNADL